MSSPIAVVTGAAGGFGIAISRSLLEKGYTLAALDRDSAGLDHLLAELNMNESLHAFALDVTQFAQVMQVACAVEDKLGVGISVLINNAGVIERSFCLSNDSGVLTEKVIGVNLTGAFHCTSAFAPYMARKKFGRIINIASIAGMWGAAGGAAYAASKAGLIKASESWARELGPLNISVTTIAPGVCKTQMMGKFMGKSSIESVDGGSVVKSMVPTGRWGVPEDIAEVVTFLATCKTNYLNAAVIPMDGGARVGSL